MSYVPPQLTPSLGAALRDVGAKRPESRAAAVEMLAGVDESDRDRAIEAVRPLLDDPVPFVRVAALAAIGRLGDHSALDVVLARLEDSDPTVREVALIAASDLGGERALGAAIAALESERPEMRFQAIAALVALAPERARGHIVSRLDDDDPKVRAHAAGALGQLGDHASSRQALAARLEDASPEVRAEAALALAAIGDPIAVPRLRALLGDPERAIVAAESLGSLCATEGARGASEAREELARIARAFLQPLMLKAAAAAALARLGDPRGVDGLRSVLTAMRADGRTYAVVAAGEQRLEALLPELVALSARPRGADPVAIAESLAHFVARSAPARGALAAMARRDDEAGLHARELLASTGGVG